MSGWGGAPNNSYLNARLLQKKCLGGGLTASIQQHWACKELRLRSLIDSYPFLEAVREAERNK